MAISQSCKAMYSEPDHLYCILIITELFIYIHYSQHVYNGLKQCFYMNMATVFLSQFCRF